MSNNKTFQHHDLRCGFGKPPEEVLHGCFAIYETDVKLGRAVIPTDWHDSDIPAPDAAVLIAVFALSLSAGGECHVCQVRWAERKFYLFNHKSCVFYIFTKQLIVTQNNLNKCF